MALVRLPLSCTDRDTISRAGELFAEFATQADQHPDGALAAQVYRRTAAACRAAVAADRAARDDEWAAQQAARRVPKSSHDSAAPGVITPEVRIPPNP